MNNFDTAYNITIEIDNSMLNDTAKQLLPDMIKQFATDLRNRMAFLGSQSAYGFTALEQSPGTGYELKEMDLTQKE